MNLFLFIFHRIEKLSLFTIRQLYLRGSLWNIISFTLLIGKRIFGLDNLWHLYLQMIWILVLCDVKRNLFSLIIMPKRYRKIAEEYNFIANNYASYWVFGLIGFIYFFLICVNFWKFFEFFTNERFCDKIPDYSYGIFGVIERTWY